MRSDVWYKYTLLWLCLLLGYIYVYQARLNGEKCLGQLGMMGAELVQRQIHRLFDWHIQLTEKSCSSNECS